MARKTFPDENAIRDAIAARLDLIEPGLSIVDTEHYLVNKDGAAGFLDILARSSTGQLVIIEIKRTRSAAREALQELHKYAALLRAKRSLKHTEYRLVLLAVDWEDLIVPYSEHKIHSPYELEAGRIILGADGLPARIEKVAPIAVPGEREIGRRHFIWHFANEADARAAIPIAAGHMRACGLRDFVLILLTLKAGLRSRYALYFAQRQLPLDVYLALIRARLAPEEMAEFEENIADYTELEDKIGEASDQVWLDGDDHTMGDFSRITAEISHPEKASQWFGSGGIVTEKEIHRFGSLADDVIDDETLLAEIVGLSGESDYRLDLSADTASPPQLARLRKAVDNVFFFNPVWRGATRDLIGYAERTGATSVRVRAFSNEDILVAIAGAAFVYPNFMPSLQIDIERNDGDDEIIVGAVEWTGRTPDFDSVLKNFFESDPFAYFMQRHFGAHRSNNLDVMAELGLEFGVFRRNEDRLERVRVAGASLTGAPVRIRTLFDFVDQNVDEVHKIVEIFMEHDVGFQSAIGRHVSSGIVEAEMALQEAVGGEPRAADGKYWIGDLEGCDCCGRPFRERRFMVDAILKGGTGANLCALCFSEHGRGLGPGLGQLYTPTPKGWLLIAG